MATNSREYDRAWYKKNRHKYQARQKKYIAEKRAYLRKLREVPCMDCKNTFPYFCMDFDHREGEVKYKSVANLIATSWPIFLREIKKCDIVCSNCHRIRTMMRLTESSNSRRTRSERANGGAIPSSVAIDG